MSISNIYPNATGTAINVWFDEVKISAVPDPASGTAILVGLVTMTMFVLPRRHAGRD